MVELFVLPVAVCTTARDEHMATTTMTMEVFDRVFEDKRNLFVVAR